MSGAFRPLEPELEEALIEDARRLGRERDFLYWRDRYFGMVAKEQERGREREQLTSIVLVSAVIGVLLLATKWLLKW